jgi:ATP-binding cassette subfamily B protein/subfamily B ATP-binding cassette protein MsbA
VNAGSNLLQAFSDEATLAVEFLAIEVLSTWVVQPYDWAGNPMLGRLPGAVAMLSALPASGAFIMLLAMALLLQALQSLAQFASSVSVGYFSARCVALVKARIHSQVLSFSFPCASRYKVGNLTNYAGSGPLAVRTQIEAYSGLLVGVLMMLTYILVLVVISPWLVLAVEGDQIGGDRLTCSQLQLVQAGHVEPVLTIETAGGDAHSPIGTDVGLVRGVSNGVVGEPHDAIYGTGESAALAA